MLLIEFNKVILMKQSKKKIKAFFYSILVIVLGFNNVISAYETEEEIDYIWIQEEILGISSESLDEPTLNSRNVVVLDRTSKEIIYGKSENTRVPMASTTKIMTAIILLENMDKNNLSLSSEIEVCKQAASIGGSRLGLKTGDKITINDLLYGLMLCSRK